MYKSKNLNNSFYCAFAFASVFVFLSFASFMRNIWGKTFNVIPAHSKSWYSNIHELSSVFFLLFYCSIKNLLDHQRHGELKSRRNRRLQLFDRLHIKRVAVR